MAVISLPKPKRKNQKKKEFVDRGNHDTLHSENSLAEIKGTNKHRKY